MGAEELHRGARNTNLAARALLESDRFGQEVTSSFESLLRRIEGVIEPMASSDVTAAWDLLAVVQRIQAMIAEGNEVLTAAALSA